MFRHLEFLNEDAINYEWPGVRAWSEEVCALVAEGELSWDDELRMDLLRISLSQDKRKPPSTSAAATTQRDGASHSHDIVFPLTPDLKAAKPGPPCRHFNAGTCSHSTDHVSNGYRQLHVCAHCLSAKCLFWPHPDKGCKSKDFKKARSDQLGFGK